MKPNKIEQEMAKRLHTHSPDKCEGPHCCIHNPSDHHMRDWPMNWRADKRVMERICPHGIGHPDPDDAAYNESIGRGWLNIHGCDGCCNESLIKKNEPSIQSSQQAERGSEV